jgi:hypothetical protein
VDAAFTAWRWFELVLGAELRFAADPRGALDYLAPKAALRFFPTRYTVAQLGVLVPVLGTDHTLVQGNLAVGAVW